MRIGIDFDEVIYPFLGTFLNFYNKKYKTNWTKNDFFSYEFPDVLNISLDRVFEELGEFFKTDAFRNAPPIEGAKEGISELKKNHELYVITGRALSLKEETESYAKNNFDGSFKSINFADFHPFERRQLNPKHKICQELGIELMIDDITTYAFKCNNENNIPVLVPKYPWNKDADFSGTKIKHVDGWKGIMEYFSENTHSQAF